jgi:uridine kinase
MTTEFWEYAPLRAWLEKEASKHSKAFIAVEGYMASGKTYLTSKLSRDLAGQHIEVDNFTCNMLYPESQSERARGAPYLSCLDLDVLRLAIVRAAASNSVTFIEGICLRDILGRIGIVCDISLYVKCVSKTSGHWHEDLNREEHASGHERFRGLDCDQYEYHSRVRPYQLANVIFSRAAD